MALNLHTSNRMERLAAALCRVVTPPLSSPFEPEIIVVQSKGMQRWLAMELAARLGIWANCRYPFPNAMVRQLFATVLPTLPDTTDFAPEILLWKIMGLLPSCLDREEFAPLRNYLAGDRNGLMRFQLSGKIADTFDQYTIFRPEMLREWEEGEGDDWQAHLWSLLAAAGAGVHRGRLKELFCQALATGIPDKLPERISIFGISYLPPYHLDIFTAVARHMDVNLFLLSPCREYWGDIVPAREQVRRPAGERNYLEEGNPLLASLGRLGRDFSEMMLGRGGVATEADLYADPEARTLLSSLQSDILNLDGTRGCVRRDIEPEDRSIQIHSCHSPLREIEVLHDNLLDLLERMPDLAPRDIVVMTPDIETYAPFIAMVFAGHRDPARKIPYAIADRSLAGEGQVAGALQKLIALPGSRLTAAELFDLLESEPVRRRFEMDAADLAHVRTWLAETRVRWGADERHRADIGLPSYRENSWAAGLDRLLLGYAMPEEGDGTFQGILPFDEVEGGNARTLGKLVEYVERAVAASRSLAAPRTLNQWREALRNLLADFIGVDDDSAPELAAVAALVESLGVAGEQAGFTDEVGLETVRSWLETRMRKEEQGYGFMTGGVTFCAMLPMRSIPFRIVALIGMNDGAFPRQSRPPGFDLIARYPRAGDRSLRDEDRYLFLECLLSARDCLYLSHMGQSIKDNSEIPPSVLVSELLDAIEAAFAVTGGQVASRLVTRHPLQAFSREYFTDNSGLFSYSGENCAALREAATNPWQPAPFLAQPLPSIPDAGKELPLLKLIRFYANPARYFVENRLGIRMEEPTAPLEDREAFAVDGLDAYGLKEALLERLLTGRDPEDLLPAIRSRGLLPPGRHGTALFAELLDEIRLFAAVVAAEIGADTPLPSCEIDLEVGGYRLSGRVDGIRSLRKIGWRCAQVKAKDQLRAWIEHLALNASGHEGYPRSSLLVMTDGTVAFGPVAEPQKYLQTLIELYEMGLTMPLRFFPESGLEYAKKLEWDLERAEKAWAPYRGKAEQDDPYFRLCFGQGSPFTAEFERVSRLLLEPLVRHYERT